MTAGTIRKRAQAVALALLVPAVAFAGELQDKIEYCKNCHGTEGQGFQGFYTAPRLAGQPVQYLENQLKAMASHRRDNPVSTIFMRPVVASIEPGMGPAIARYFGGLNPPPADGGTRGLVSQGRKIYNEGIPDENVPACAACHGPDGKGSEAIPRLAGQFYAYTVAQLKGWNKGYRSKDPVSGETNTMVAIADSMTPEQMSAVAAYLSYQR
jgi:cytochrome c553